MRRSSFAKHLITTNRELIQVVPAIVQPPCRMSRRLPHEDTALTPWAWLNANRRSGLSIGMFRKQQLSDGKADDESQTGHEIKLLLIA
jgi:hypothetical protein